MGQMPDGVCHDTYITYLVAVLPLEYPIGSFLLFHWEYTMVHATYEPSRVLSIPATGVMGRVGIGSEKGAHDVQAEEGHCIDYRSGRVPQKSYRRRVLDKNIPIVIVETSNTVK